VKRVAILALLVWLAASACGAQPAPKSVAYRLYTHCGILYADLYGTRYYADPPVSDGNSNPTRGWGNPYDEGTLTEVDANTVVFTDPAGNRATFRTHPASGIPTIYPCD
jgi:hypothetical protein